MFLKAARLIDTLNEKVANIVSWALVAAVVICAANALLRYGLNLSSNAWLEIQWYLFAAMFLLAAPHTLKRDEHVRIDVVAGRFSKRAQAWMDLFGFVLFLLPVCALILWYAIPYAMLSLRGGEMSMNAGGLLQWPAKMLIPAGFLLMILQGVSEIIKRIAFLAGRVDASAFGKPHDGAPALGE
ncbi:TRAP transporter small permease subunit [Pseudoduganella sp. GCM10020061]|uniref:TRAP transporter small permease subunit n=1 Tax=Pseudoduganella sp. GCM10020061 TaxID=3317345 RepID=UPI0036301FEA